MPDQDLFGRLRQLLLRKRAAFVACADLGTLPVDTRDGLPRGITIGVALDPVIVDSLRNGPNAEFDAEYERTSELRKTVGEACVAFLRAEGLKAATVPGRLSIPKPGTLSSALPHKTVATLAGVGWIGKCSLLVTERYGSAVRLVSVLTDAQLPVGTPVTQSSCGDCRECVDACPVGALTGQNWQRGMPRKELFDASACERWHQQLATSTSCRHAQCYSCVTVCPWTGSYLQSRGQT